MIDADSLIAGLEGEAEKLRALGVKIAAELDRGADARINEIDILRPAIMQGLASLNRLLLQCGHVPPPARPRALTALADKMRVESNLWSACDQVIALQVPPRARPLTAARGPDPSQNSTAIALLDRAMSREGLEMSLCASALHAAYRVLLARGEAGDATFVHLSCTDRAPVQAAAALFPNSKGVAASGVEADGAIHEGDPTDASWVADAQVVLIELEGDALEQVIGQVSPGTLLLIPDAGFIHRAQDLRCAYLAPLLYLAGAGEEEAEALQEAASFTGLSLPTVRAQHSSVWQAIFDSSARRGFYASSPDVSFIV